MVKKKRPEGTAARQAHLLESAIAVVGKGGLRGLTHRAVDRAADLPEGTCSVYFRTRLALLTALTGFVAQRLTDDVRRMGESLPDPSIDPAAAIEATVEMVVRWSGHPALLITMTDLHLESVRTPSLRATSDAWRDGLVEVVEGVLQRIEEKEDPRKRALSIVASVEGVALSALTMPTRERKTFLRDTLTMVISNLV
ncbi:MAG: hypothetical protein ABI360_07425 [Allobranchiibius sp.]